MLRKLGEKVGDFLVRRKKPKKSAIAKQYERFVREGVHKEIAFRRALKMARETHLQK